MARVIKNRIMPTAIRSAIYNRKLLNYIETVDEVETSYELTPSCLVYIINWMVGTDGNGNYYTSLEVPILLPGIISVNITKDSAAFSQTATIVMSNVNPTDPYDSGYYNHHRDDTAHGKPANSWADVIRAGRRVRICMGYGVDEYEGDIGEQGCPPVFFGYIDNVLMDMGTEKSTIEITCRDMGKMLMEGSCNYYSISEEKTYWEMYYPIDEEDVRVSNDPLIFNKKAISNNEFSAVNYDLGYIVKDICLRGGFFLENAYPTNTFITGMTINNLSDVELAFANETWDSCINKIKDITAYDFWVDEDGYFHFENVQNRSINIPEQVISFTSSDTRPINGANNMYFPVESSAVVTNMAGSITYTKDVDYSIDDEGSTITRIDTGSIADYASVKLTIDCTCYCFKAGKDIIQLPLSMGHEKIYGRVVVTGDGVDAYADLSSPSTPDLPNGSYGPKLWDDSCVLWNKVLNVENTNLVTEEDCQVVADRIVHIMKEKYESISFQCIPVPWLGLYDIIQVVLYGTISEAYQITGIELSYDAESSSFTQVIKANHYAYASS